MWARFTVLSDTPIAAAIAGCAIPLSRNNTIWMRWRCAAGIFHRSAVFSRRTSALLHLTICSSESDGSSESHLHAEKQPVQAVSLPCPNRPDSRRYGAGITPVYGQTELSPIVCQTSPDDTLEDKASSSGRPLWQVEVRVVDTASGKILASGLEGEIQARGYQSMISYFDMPEAS